MAELKTAETMPYAWIIFCPHCYAGRGHGFIDFPFVDICGQCEGEMLVVPPDEDANG